MEAGAAEAAAKRMNECMARHAGDGGWVRVFDEFWRRGEVALMFGAPGVGKSVLAVQIAEAIARGSDIAGFDLEAEPERVLYVDLVMPEAHFTRRYSTVRFGRTIHHKFSERLFVVRPAPGGDVIGHIRTAAAETGARYVIVDDVDAVRRTGGGTLEAMRLMRELRRMAGEMGVSVLAVAGSRSLEDGAAPTEKDLGPRAAMCSLADSVFAIGRWWRRPDTRYIVQTRSRNAPITWTTQNAPGATLRLDAAGMLRFEFDAPPGEELRERICRINAMRMEGLGYREIGRRLGISKSHAQRLGARWNFGLEKKPWWGVRDDGGGEASPADAGIGESLLAPDPGRCPGLSSYAPSGLEEVSGERSGLEEVLAERSDPEEVYADRSGFEDVYADHLGFGEVSAGDSGFEEVSADHSGIEKVPGDLSGVGGVAVVHSGAEDGQGDPLGGEGAAAPFYYDGSAEAEEWFQRLVREHPDMSDTKILSDYAVGEEWCRPPGAVPPYDPEDPFGKMEIEYSLDGDRVFVEERDHLGLRKVFYMYASNGQLRKWERDGEGCSGSAANPNFFGRFASITREELLRMRARSEGFAGGRRSTRAW